MYLILVNASMTYFLLVLCANCGSWVETKDLRSSYYSSAIHIVLDSSRWVVVNPVLSIVQRKQSYNYYICILTSSTIIEELSFDSSPYGMAGFDK